MKLLVILRRVVATSFVRRMSLSVPTLLPVIYQSVRHGATQASKHQLQRFRQLPDQQSVGKSVGKRTITIPVVCEQQLVYTIVIPRRKFDPNMANYEARDAEVLYVMKSHRIRSLEPCA